jgi:hypothetical protein
MKKGKSCSIKGYKKFKCSYGTVDSKNLKSIYFNLQSWVEPKIFEMNWTRIISIITRNIKVVLSEVLNKNLFSDKYIVDLDLRSSGITMKKRSFMNLEITLFLKIPTEFKSIEVRNEVKKYIDTINQECFKNNKFFNFHFSKSSESKKIKNESL